MSCSARAADWRRANASRLRTIFAARSDSSAIRRRSCESSAVGAGGVGFARLAQFLLEELRVADHAGQRVVQLVRDAGDELADRRELLGLQQLRLRRLEAIDGRDQAAVGGGELVAHLLHRGARSGFRCVTFFAICTIAAPSVASSTGQVVTLKI